MKRALIIVLLFSAIRGGAQEHLPYTIDRHVEANHCEFYVNSFARGYWYYMGNTGQVLATYISVNTQDLVGKQKGRVLNVGMYARVRLVSSGTSAHVPVIRVAELDEWAYGTEIEPAYYHLKFRFEDRREPATPEWKELSHFAFFLDIKRSDGTIDRVWMKNGDRDFRLDVVFDGCPTHLETLGKGSLSYVKEPSPIYHQKQACRP